jgi:hypothetical protein
MGTLTYLTEHPAVKKKLGTQVVYGNDLPENGPLVTLAKNPAS